MESERKYDDSKVVVISNNPINDLKAMLQKELGFPDKEDIPKGKLYCPYCQKFYIPIHSSKQEAEVSGDKVSKEQWISGICSQKCWDKLFPPFDDYVQINKEIG